MHFICVCNFGFFFFILSYIAIIVCLVFFTHGWVTSGCVSPCLGLLPTTFNDFAWVTSLELRCGLSCMEGFIFVPHGSFLVEVFIT